jgi:hypothetical protein
VEYILCLPGTSAPVERVFSAMNNVWSEERGRMAESTVKDLIYCKLNTELGCTELYGKKKKKTTTNNF